MRGALSRLSGFIVALWQDAAQVGVAA